MEDVGSDYLHKTLDQLASALNCAPENMALNREYFAVMDERTSSDKSLVICRVEGERTKRVDWLRSRPEPSTLTFVALAIVCISWDEVKTGWERKRQMGQDVLD